MTYVVGRVATTVFQLGFRACHARRACENATKMQTLMLLSLARAAALGLVPRRCHAIARRRVSPADS